MFDLETNGLLNDVTCIHCLVIYDSEADETYVYNDQGTEEPIVRGIQLLEDAEVICGHNVISYDIRVIEKLYPWFIPTALVVDTLLLMCNVVNGVAAVCCCSWTLLLLRAAGVAIVAIDVVDVDS